MVTRRIKQLFALSVVAALVSSCASKPAEEADDSSMMGDNQEVMEQPVQPAPVPAPAPKPDATVRNSSLYELNSNDQYVAVGNGKFYFDFDQALEHRTQHL